MSTRRLRTLSAVVPQATECAPQALLAIMPPRVQRLAEEGVKVEARAVPAEKPVELADLQERWGKAG